MRGEVWLAVGAGVTMALLGVWATTPQRPAHPSWGALQQTWTPVDPPRPLRGLDLMGHDGVTRTEVDLQGEWHVLVVGFLSCPDVCPAALTGLASALKQDMPAQAWFLTVDPDNDALEAVSEYVTWFDPRMLGVRAEGTALSHAMSELGLAYQESGWGPSRTVEHSTSAAVINPHGELVGYMLRPADGRALAEEVRTLVAANSPSDATADAAVEDAESNTDR